MPDLHELLTDAVPPAEPAFGVEEVRAKASGIERRQRRVVSGVALSLVVLLAVLVVPSLLHEPGVRPVGSGELVPLPQWPSSVEFAGVEVGVHVHDEPDEAMQRRVRLADGDAAFNVMPSDAVTPPTRARQMVVNRLWFTCGTDQVVRVQEIGQAEGAPETASGRFLMAGALVEVARQLVEAHGCTPSAPAGTPAAPIDAQPAVQTFSRLLDRAGLAISAGQLGFPDELPPAPLMNVWSDGLWLPIEVGAPETAPPGLDAVSQPTLVEDGVAVCDEMVLRLQGGGERLPAFASVLQQIGCQPEVASPQADATASPAAGPLPSDVPPEAARLIETLQAAGRAVSAVTVEDTATTFHARPTGPGVSDVWISVDADPDWDVTGDTPLVLLAGGEAAVLDGGLLAFHCGDGLSLRTTGPGAGGSELAWVADLVDVVDCDPRPPGLARSVTADDGSQVERFMSIREARLADAIAALGLPACCGEPSHGGSGAATGMVFEGSEVRLSAGPPTPRDPQFQYGEIIGLADGEADAGDGDGLPLIAFTCGDTRYLLQHDTPNDSVHIRAAEALVGVLDCTPTVG